MKNKIFGIILGIFFIQAVVLADAFVPDFTAMKTIRCDFDETVYNQDNSVVSKSHQFRIYKLDDEYQKIYLQKEPIDNVIYYGTDKIDFALQTLTDDVIIMSRTDIDRTSMDYNSTSTITYDNDMFGVRTSKSVGTCKPLP
jgi:hypothetical protein